MNESSLLEKLAPDCLPNGWTLFGCLNGEWKERRTCTTGDNAKAKCRAQMWAGCLSGGGMYGHFDLFAIFDPAGRPWKVADPARHPLRIVWEDPTPKPTAAHSGGSL